MRTNDRTPFRAGAGRLVVAGAVLGAMTAGWAAAPAGAAQAQISISAVKTPKHGTVLVTRGSTVYTLKPSSTACTSACLQIWPAVMLAQGQVKPVAGHGVKASQLGTVSVTGGEQVTYKGQPLYRYVGDKKPGQVKGNFTDQWGKWAAVVTVKPGHPSGSGSASMGSGGSSTGSGSTGSGGSSTGSGGASF